MPTFAVEIHPAVDPAAAGDEQLVALLRDGGAGTVRSTREVRLFALDGPRLERDAVETIARDVLADPITERVVVRATADPPLESEGETAFEVHPRPGVMDPVAETTLAELRARGFGVTSVRTGRRYLATGDESVEALVAAAARVLANDCIEQIVPGIAPLREAPTPPAHEFKLRHVALRAADTAELDALSRNGHLFLTRDEMRAVQAHFTALGREPTDLELETIAQTWSEHCVHKTLRSAYVYRGAALPRAGHEGVPSNRDARRDGATFSAADVELKFDNLLKDTIVRATNELMAEGRGPQCLSVFQDNAGIIAFDDEFGVAFKVETHNHPSAIEPYGGAATGVGGCIRDVIGCGLGARPIANTDVFCVAPSDWPQDGLPRGVLHPARVLRGIVQGVADYGNRMGIPTVNGAVYFDPRYLGNPLVYCGCVGLIPRDRIEKAAAAGDRIVLIGGRTGRDGIHGATFSSAELTDTHADEFSHAVQIGNAITEKRVLDGVMAARDADGGCLYSAITDCGAGGLSSAVGEMAAAIGAVVDLESVPLKYAGLRYDEIWVSEAQERMVLAVPPAKLDRLMRIMADEVVEATVIGTFGTADAADSRSPRLIIRYAGVVVGELDMHFLHDGLPRGERSAVWTPPSVAAGEEFDRQGSHSTPDEDAVLAALTGRLRSPNTNSREWIIRKYDHEVQGGTLVKPLCGPTGGPGDAAVLRPRAGSQRGIAIGCGLAPHLSDVDPYWMAVNAIDEAIRNVVCVGGDPARIAILDNFCWGRTDDPQNLGALVRACQACYDAAKAFGTPFISGKDSLNNEFLLDPRDVEPLLATLRARANSSDDARTAAIENRIRASGRLGIPPTLLISAVALIDDVRRCVTADLKQPGNALLFVGGLPQVGLSLAAAARVHAAVGAAIRAGHVGACHDVSDGGWLVSVAEMALAAGRGVRLKPVADCAGCFDGLAAGYVIETRANDALCEALRAADVPVVWLGEVGDDSVFRLNDQGVNIAALDRAWRGHP